VEIGLDDGRSAVATAPAGASTGRHEARELRDGGERYDGFGVDRAVKGTNDRIASLLRGRFVTDQSEIDRALIEFDSTADRSDLGANAIVATSMAVARCGALARGVPLRRALADGFAAASMPIPLMNFLNGGAHAADGLRIQECMLVPHGPSATPERIRCGAEIYAALHRLLSEGGASTAVGDEGGFVFSLGGVDDALDMMRAAIERAGYRPGIDCSLAIDAAANNLRREDGAYVPERGLELSTGAFVDWWEALLDKHPVVLIEDPSAEEDRDGWAALTRRLGTRVTIVGDDNFRHERKNDPPSSSRRHRKRGPPQAEPNWYRNRNARRRACCP